MGTAGIEPATYTMSPWRSTAELCTLLYSCLVFLKMPYVYMLEKPGLFTRILSGDLGNRETLLDSVYTNISFLLQDYSAILDEFYFGPAPIPFQSKDSEFQKYWLAKIDKYEPRIKVVSLKIIRLPNEVFKVELTFQLDNTESNFEFVFNT